MASKSELRKIYLAKRKKISSDERIEKSRLIAERFFQFFNLSEIKYLHCFLPIEKFNEVNTQSILERIWRELPQIITIVPRVDFKNDEIENLVFTSETALTQNQWQIHEPAHNQIIETKNIDLIIIPLLAFDKRGFRVGYGKGFYDKLINRCRSDVLKIGLSFFPPVEKISDVHKYDAKLDFCVTPEDIARFS